MWTFVMKTHVDTRDENTCGHSWWKRMWTFVMKRHVDIRDENTYGHPWWKRMWTSVMKTYGHSWWKSMWTFVMKTHMDTRDENTCGHSWWKHIWTFVMKTHVDTRDEKTCGHSRWKHKLVVLGKWILAFSFVFLFNAVLSKLLEVKISDYIYKMFSSHDCGSIETSLTTYSPQVTTFYKLQLPATQLWEPQISYVATSGEFCDTQSTLLWNVINRGLWRHIYTNTRVIILELLKLWENVLNTWYASIL